MGVLVSTENLTHDEWLIWRRRGIGGSDVAAVCGLSRYKSPMEVYLDKTGDNETKIAGEYAYWGNVLEPVVRDEFVRRTGLEVQQEKAIFQHPKYPFMLANLDGFVICPDRGKGIFEAKTANAFISKEWLDGNIPDEYVLQVQHYFCVTGLSFAYIAVLIGGNTFKWQLIERDEAIIALLLKLETKFWHNVETNTPPKFDGSKGSTELLSRLYPNGKAKSQIVLPDEAELLVNAYELAYDLEKEAAKRKDEAGNQLKAMLGENESGVVGGRSVSWKSISSERLNSKTLKVEQPAIYQKYVETSSYRKFSIK